MQEPRGGKVQIDFGDGRAESSPRKAVKAVKDRRGEKRFCWESKKERSHRMEKEWKEEEGVEEGGGSSTRSP